MTNKNLVFEEPALLSLSRYLIALGICVFLTALFYIYENVGTELIIEIIIPVLLAAGILSGLTASFAKKEKWRCYSQVIFAISILAQPFINCYIFAQASAENRAEVVLAFALMFACYAALTVLAIYGRKGFKVS